MSKATRAIPGLLPEIVIILAAAVGIFIIPWFVPVGPSISLCYTYGFSNRAAQCFAAMGLVALLILYWIRGRNDAGPSEVTNAICEALRLSDAGQPDRGLFLSFIMVAGLVSCALTAWYCYIPYAQYGEMGYFLSRIDLLVLHRAAYYDFSFVYGPAMIYLPYYLYEAAHGGLSVEQAYCVVLVGHWIAGYYLLYYCVRLLIPAGRRVIVFWVIASIAFNPTMGMNYTPFRYLLPLASLLWVHAAMMRMPRRPAAWIAVASCAGPYVSFQFSPEIGIAATLSMAIYMGAWAWKEGRRHMWLAVFPMLGAAGALLPWTSHYIRILSVFGGDIPILPGPGILLLLAAAFFLIPRMALIGFGDRTVAGAAGLAICTQAGLLLVPALTRCDLGHVFFNGLGLFLVAFAVVARLPGRWFPVAGWAVFLVFAVVGSWLTLFHYSYFFKHVLAARAELRAGAAVNSANDDDGAGFHFSKPLPARTGMEALLRYGPLAVPMGSSEEIDRYLKLNGKFVPLFSPGLEPESYTPAQAAMRMRALEDVPTLLVAKGSLTPTDTLTPAQQTAADMRFLTVNELFPVRLHPRHPVYSADAYVAAGLSKEFSVIGEFRDYVIMRNRGVGGQ